MAQSEFPCPLCEAKFDWYTDWYEHMCRMHDSELQKVPENVLSSSANTISLGQCSTLTDDEKAFIESSSSSSSQADTANAKLPPVLENETDISNNEDLHVATSEDLDVAEQSSVGLPNWAFSGESNPLLSSGQRANMPTAVWPNIYAEANSDHINEPSTSYQQDLALTSSSQCEDSTLPYLENNTVAADTKKAFEFPPFKEKNGGRFTEESPAPIDLKTKLRVVADIKKLRKPEQFERPRLKELFGAYMLPVIDPITGYRVMRPCIVEVQSSKPYGNQELRPALSPQEIAAIREAGGSPSRGMDEEMGSADEDMEVADEGNNYSDEGISVSENEEDETVNVEDEEDNAEDEEVNVED